MRALPLLASAHPLLLAPYLSIDRYRNEFKNFSNDRTKLLSSPVKLGLPSKTSHPIHRITINSNSPANISSTPLRFSSPTMDSSVLFQTKSRGRHTAPFPPCTAELTFAGTYTSSNPSGRLMLCAELDVPKCNWSVFARLLSQAILKLLSNYAGPDFSWSIGDPAKNIKPHIAIPLLKVRSEATRRCEFHVDSFFTCRLLTSS